MATRQKKEEIKKKVEQATEKVAKKKDKQIESVSEERDFYHSLLLKIIKNQKNTRKQNYINIICWIVCFSLLVWDKL